VRIASVLVVNMINDTASAHQYMHIKIAGLCHSVSIFWVVAQFENHHFYTEKGRPEDRPSDCVCPSAISERVFRITGP